MDEKFQKAEAAVEKAIASFGVNAADVRVKADDTAVTYSLMRGSALTLITVAKREDDTVLRVICPVMSLPDSEKHLAFFQRLLELNASMIVGSAAFALAGERVVVVSERPVAGMDEHEAAHVIRRASAVADTFDDRLVREFGGQRASQR
jgi:hypothetical protein